MGIKEKIINKVTQDLENSFNEFKGDLTSEQKAEFDDLKRKVRSNMDKQIGPIIDEGIKPILQELDKLNKAVTKMNTILPAAFATIPTGAGASSLYSGSAPTADLNRITTNIQKLKSEV